MRIQEAIRHLMKEQHVTLEAMGERMGGITKMAVHGALNGRKQKSMSVDRAVCFLDRLGYEMAAVPKGSRLPNGSMAIEAAGGESDD